MIKLYTQTEMQLLANSKLITADYKRRIFIEIYFICTFCVYDVKSLICPLRWCAVFYLRKHLNSVLCFFEPEEGIYTLKH